MLVFVGEGIGSMSSYLLYGLLAIYIFTNKFVKPNLWLLLIGISYYMLSGLHFVYRTDAIAFIIAFVKFIIIILAGNILVKKVNNFEFFVFLLIGSFSVIIHNIFFPDAFGRYSGLYLNPNAAGFIAIIGYALTYGLRNKYLKTSAQIIFTIAGIITFSRTFLVIWGIINLLSLKISIKNVRILAAGLALLISLITFGELFKFDTMRLEQFTAVLNNEKGGFEKANKDSRTETWATYYDDILEKPFLGNGYGALSGFGIHFIGVHNSFLMILGESGLIPFIIFTSLYLYIFIWGLKLFKIAPNILMQSIALILFLLTNHNFFTTDYIIISTLWVHWQIIDKKPYYYEAIS